MSHDRFMLKRDDMALIVIDIQEKLLAAMKEDIAAGVVRNAGILIETAKAFGIPTIVSEQYRKGLGPTVAPLREKLACGIQEKLHFDCTKDDACAKTIATVGKKTFVLAGIETHVCVFQTALSLLARGYAVVVASDAVASRRTHDWKQSLRALERAGAIVYPTETISFIVMEKAGTEEFKKLAPLFK